VLVFSALIVGSLAPDFHYFFNVGPHGHFSHSIKGAFVFALPTSLAVLWVFQTVMKAPLINLAPERHQQRLAGLDAPFHWWPAGRFALILFSLMVGIATHLVWDSITHERGLVVRKFADLRTPALDEFGSERPLYDLLQEASGLVGMAVLVVWYWRWFRRAPIQPAPDHQRLGPGAKVWITTIVLAGSAGAAIVFAYIVSRGSQHEFSLFGETSVITFMSLTFTGALTFSLWWQWRTGLWNRVRR
jgi:hypothetical protein